MNDVAKPGLADCAEIFYSPSEVFERRRGGEWAGPFFVFVIAFTDREFGPMHAAEGRARLTGATLGPGAIGKYEPA